MSEEIKLPHYEALIIKGVHEMGIKFKNYGNDWVDKDAIYWKERILKEVKEYIDSMTIDSEKRKLINILNMIAMAYETIENRGCVQHIVDFDIIVISKGTQIHVPCDKCGTTIWIENGTIQKEDKIE